MIFDTGNRFLDAALALALGLYIILFIAGWQFFLQAAKMARDARAEAGIEPLFSRPFIVGAVVSGLVLAPVVGIAYLRAASLGQVSRMWEGMTRAFCGSTVRHGILSASQAIRFYQAVGRALARDMGIDLTIPFPEPSPSVAVHVIDLHGDGEIEDPPLDGMGVPDCGDPSCTLHGNLDANLTMESYSEEFLTNEKNLCAFNEAALALVDLPDDASAEQVREAWLATKGRMTCAIRAYHLASIAGIRQRLEEAAARGTIRAS